MLTAIFHHARIYDGSGMLPYTTDVALDGERVALVGDCSERDAFEHVDARGLALAPGFIDVHSHTDELWLVEPAALSKLAQGVTTEIAGNCGSSVAPLSGAALERKRGSVARYGLELEWTDFDTFFALVERNGIAINVASLVGLGTTRRCVSGDADRRLERDEMDRQRSLVREAVEQGALGVSSGLIYEPSRYATTDELIGLASEARTAGAARYASHIRNEGDRLLEAVDEALVIGQRADVQVQCSHHKAAGRRNWGKVHASLEMIDRARERGLDVFADVYPYIASWTELATILPDDVRSGGIDATLARLQDPPTATAVMLALNLARDESRGGDSWHDILVTDVGSSRNEHLAGMRMDEIAAQWRLSPARAALRLLVEERLDVQCAFFSMNEDDVATVLGADFTCIGSDASARSTRGVTAHGVPHPRTFGTFPRVFGRFVRGRHTLSMEEAVRRMTSLPARIFGMRDRGTIAPGAYADLVLFDPERIVDRASYTDPYVLPEGIVRVYVNGACALRDGTPTGARSGRVLRGGGA